MALGSGVKMAACGFRDRCNMFEGGRLSGFSGIALLFEARYCSGDPAKCVRNKLAEVRGFDSVPSDMYPNDVARARGLMDVAV